eukprot:5304810-Prymnesium_polylepis.1
MPATRRAGGAPRSAGLPSMRALGEPGSARVTKRILCDASPNARERESSPLSRAMPVMTLRARKRSKRFGGEMSRAHGTLKRERRPAATGRRSWGAPDGAARGEDPRPLALLARLVIA